MNATIQAWLDEALADAARRGLPELAGLLRSLARSTEALRAADWNDTVSTRLGADAPGRVAGAPAEGNR